MKTRFNELTGRTTSHLQRSAEGLLIHCDAAPSWQTMVDRAAEDGIQLRIASGFRDYDRQLAIWQGKVGGSRPLYDRSGRLCEVTQMLPADVLDAILRWSALPGLSRHHWGTDFDVYDAAAVSPDYRLQLVPDEYLSGGPFYRMSQWLSDYGPQLGFFRPYEKDLGGVAPEPWHVSCGAVASVYESLLSMDLFRHLLEEEKWPLNAQIAERAESIYQRYVCNCGSGDGRVGREIL